MIIALRDESAAVVGRPIDRIAITHSTLPGLGVGDPADAPAEPPTSAGIYPVSLTEGHSAFAAHGLGL
ncbi:hypothetical protein F4776DRAFT_619308 [Hypoxylon sp. NC0597]|nr:hypothetical protein F4776DRAFT_619308 [Hypoxylon sp. NC0597]